MVFHGVIFRFFGGEVVGVCGILGFLYNRDAVMVVERVVSKFRRLRPNIVVGGAVNGYLLRDFT